MEIAITHSTTACTLLEIGSLRILTDPVFDCGKRRYRLGPGAWTTRYTDPSIDPKKLLPIDAALVSHAHLDNMDSSGIEVLKNVRQVITARQTMKTRLPSAIALAPWEEYTLNTTGSLPIKVTATPALHGPAWLPGVRDPIGFVLEWVGQKHGPLYVSGDTVFFSGIRQIRKRIGRIGTAMIHLGAVHFWPPWPPCFRFTFNGRDAARCAHLLELHTMIPIHYERSVWSHFREELDSYRRTFRQAGLDNVVRWLRPGERTVFDV